MISMMTSCLRLALTKLVEIVGEAAKHVSNDLRASHPEVPWSAATRMRDRLVHHYFDINLDVLWTTVTDDLPRLLAVLPADLIPHSSILADHDRRRIDKQ
ncbi:MAG: HepT-like ribonuclease domain-containing protein [Pseudonocardiaceae bacterium]